MGQKILTYAQEAANQMDTKVWNVTPKRRTTGIKTRLALKGLRGRNARQNMRFAVVFRLIWIES